MSKEDFIHAEGRVTEILPNSKFNILLDNGLTIRATLSGKMRKNSIFIVLDDRVSVEISPYDLTQGRITYRFKN